MQVQTTTIETTNQTSYGANFQITTIEQTTTAFCDCCNAQSTGTKDQLRRRGWGFASGAEFCPMCNG